MMNEWGSLGWQLLLVAVFIFAVLCRVGIYHLVETRGAVARGVVVDRVRNRFNADYPYAVYYEFSVPNAYGAMSVYIGCYTGDYAFQKNDVIGVRYWARYPRLNRVIERAV